MVSVKKGDGISITPMQNRLEMLRNERFSRELIPLQKWSHNFPKQRSFLLVNLGKKNSWIFLTETLILVGIEKVPKIWQRHVHVQWWMTYIDNDLYRHLERLGKVRKYDLSRQWVNSTLFVEKSRNKGIAAEGREIFGVFFRIFRSQKIWLKSTIT